MRKLSEDVSAKFFSCLGNFETDSRLDIFQTMTEDDEAIESYNTMPARQRHPRIGTESMYVCDLPWSVALFIVNEETVV